MSGAERENIEGLIEELKEFSREGIIIVEGKKDVKAMNSLGIRSIELKGAVFEFAENIDSRKVLILTDFDRKGEELHAKIKEALSRRGIEEDMRLRKKFKSVTKLSHIEGFKMPD